MVRGEVLGVLGRFDEANVAFQFALHQGGEPSERIAVLLRQARLHADQGVTASALESLQLAEGILGELDDLSIHGAEIASLKASAHRISGDYAASRAACQSGLEQLTDDTQGADGVHASLSREMGFAAFYQGESLEALQWFEASRNSEEARGARLGVLTANISIATVHHRQGKLKEAFDAYRAALETARELGDRAREGALRMNLGVIHQERSEHGAAIAEYEAACHLSEALGDRGGVLRVRNNLGNLLLHLGDFQEARVQITRSLTLSRMEGNQYIEAYNLTLLGELARVEKQQATALERLGEARTLFDAQGCRHEVMEVDLERAQTLADGMEFKAALEIAQSVRKAANKADSNLVEVKACALIAETERSAPDGDLESASVAISSALEMLDTVDGLEVRWPVYVTAARVTRDRGDLEQARGHAADALEGLRTLVRDLPPALQGQYRYAHGRREAEEEMRWVEALAGSPGAASAAPPSRGGHGNFGKLLEINKRLNMVHDLARLLEYIMDSAVLLTGAERGFLLLPSEKADVLDVRVARNIDEENIGEGRFKISTSIAERVLAAGEPVLTIDAMEDERYREMLSVHAQRLRSVLCVPMRRAGRTIGAIYIDNRFQVEAFGDEDVAFMEAFADQAGIALGNASLFEENRLAREELEISEKEIAKLNKKLEERLALTSQQLEESQTRVQRQQRQLSNRHQYANIVGNSAGLQEVLFVVDRVRDNDVPVLVTGESGTGKELVARAIHYNGRRKSNEFVAVNCGSIPANLFESELFGHVRGAFTGANVDKKGLFEVAHRGTLFLDELGELPLEMQVKLLRVLQQGELKRVGGNRTVKVDVRVVGATNRNVLDMVESGLFREDLYYRLNVVSVRVPPLRERPDDIPALVQHFLTLNKESGLTQIDRIDAPALSLLSRHPWRGNIRELDTVLKNASLFADGDELTVDDFQPLLGMDGIGRASMGSATESGVDFHVGVPLAELEREAIIRTLEAQGGNKKRTAEILGIDRRTLYNKLSLYGVQIEKRARVRIPK
jgi:transcriptional regulator with GAF, ATPase, and Fis domain/Tfp pilus assembly protein PilF